MVNSLFLSHVSKRYTNEPETRRYLRALSKAPEARSLGQFLEHRVRDPRKMWEDLDQAQREAKLTQRILVEMDIHAVDYWSEKYPVSLRTIEFPPWILFYIGELPLNTATLAVVGSRRPNAYGVELLAHIVPKISLRPIQIVSGLAYGVDALAHFHACEARIPNFAVLGCGLDTLYPPEHLDLANRILKSGGGLLSEHPPGVLPHPGNFPKRNRIISGLSDLVWVVQGTPRSGSVHTVTHALEQGRMLAGTPGDIFSELSEVPNKLLYDGASFIMKAGDVDTILSHVRTTIAR